jgi:hypothetical protein
VRCACLLPNGRLNFQVDATLRGYGLSVTTHDHSASARPSSTTPSTVYNRIYTPYNALPPLLRLRRRGLPAFMGLPAGIAEQRRRQKLCTSTVLVKVQHLHCRWPQSQTMSCWAQRAFPGRPWKALLPVRPAAWYLRRTGTAFRKPTGTLRSPGDVAHPCNYTPTSLLGAVFSPAPGSLTVWMWSLPQLTYGLLPLVCI